MDALKAVLLTVWPDSYLYNFFNIRPFKNEKNHQMHNKKLPKKIKCLKILNTFKKLLKNFKIKPQCQNFDKCDYSWKTEFGDHLAFGNAEGTWALVTPIKAFRLLSMWILPCMYFVIFFGLSSHNSLPLGLIQSSSHCTKDLHGLAVNFKTVLYVCMYVGR